MRGLKGTGEVQRTENKELINGKAVMKSTGWSGILTL